MIDWLARARVHFAQAGLSTTDKTDESRVVSVSSVRPAANADTTELLSSVSSAPLGPIPANCRARANPIMTLEQSDECHAGGWNDAEIAAFTARATRFALARPPDAEHLAERLTLRDRQADDRRMCLECSERESSGRCGAAHRGAIPGADRMLVPVPDILMRCEGFSER